LGKKGLFFNLTLRKGILGENTTNSLKGIIMEMEPRKFNNLPSYHQRA